MTEARAAVAKVRAARGYYPLGGKATGKGKGQSPMRCLICGQPGHLFRECPKRFQSQAAMYQKGSPKGGFGTGYKAAGKGRGKIKQGPKDKLKPSVPAYFHGAYMMEAVREEFFDNGQPAERSQNVTVPNIDPSDLTMGNETTAGRLGFLRME